MAGYNVDVAQADLYAIFQPWVASVTGLDPSVVIDGLDNRVAPPLASPGYISIQAILQVRLNTNEDSWTYETDPSGSDNNESSEAHYQVALQLDCYGALSQTWVTILQTLLRDDVGCIALAGDDPTTPICQPLYTDEPIMVPLVDSEAQYEQRWTLTAQLQYDPIVTAPLQFANEVDLTVYDVDVEFPAI
jgi:hypothetical protein